MEQALMLFTCVYVLLTSAEASNMHGNYTPHWAVQIRGGPDVANRLAAKHGFFNMGLIANLENVYDFKLAYEDGDKREPMSEKTLALSQEPEVGFVEQQYYRKMVPKTG